MNWRYAVQTLETLSHDPDSRLSMFPRDVVQYILDPYMRSWFRGIFPLYETYLHGTVRYIEFDMYARIEYTMGFSTEESYNRRGDGSLHSYRRYKMREIPNTTRSWPRLVLEIVWRDDGLVELRTEVDSSANVHERLPPDYRHVWEIMTRTF